MKYLLFCFVCYGITINLVYTDVKFYWPIKKFSILVEMLDCVKCTGFWVGIGLSLLLFVCNYFSLAFVLEKWNLLDIIWAGFLSSGSCWFLDGLRKER